MELLIIYKIFFTRMGIPSIIATSYKSCPQEKKKKKKFFSGNYFIVGDTACISPVHF